MRMKRTMLGCGLVWSLAWAGACADLSDGLVAWYAFDQGSLGTDSSGNGYHGSAGALKRVPGVVGAAALFDGVAHMEVESLRGFNWGDALSVSLWFQRTGGWGLYMGLVNNGNPGQASFDLRLGRERAGGLFTASLASYSDPRTDDFNEMVAPAEKWNHAVMTYDGSNLVVFLNGEKRVSRGRDEGRIINFNAPLLVGRGDNRRSETFVGMMDEIRIYRRALTDEECLELFRLGGGRPPLPVPAPMPAAPAAPAAPAEPAEPEQVPAPVPVDPAPAPAPVPVEPVAAAPVPAAVEAPPPAPASPAPAPEVQAPAEPMAPVAAPAPIPAPAVSPAAPAPAPEAVAGDETNCCAILARWLEQWKSGAKQQVIDELNARARR